MALTLRHLLDSPAVVNVALFENEMLPIVARRGDGTLCHFGSVTEGQIRISGDAHDAIVLVLNEEAQAVEVVE